MQRQRKSLKIPLTAFRTRPYLLVLDTKPGNQDLIFTFSPFVFISMEAEKRQSTRRDPHLLCSRFYFPCHVIHTWSTLRLTTLIVHPPRRCLQPHFLCCFLVKQLLHHCAERVHEATYPCLLMEQRFCGNQPLWVSIGLQRPTRINPFLIHRTAM